jgi:hypothetical protein
VPRELGAVLLITVHPDHVAPTVLSSVDALVAVGDEPDVTLQSFCAALGQRAPVVEPAPLAAGEVLVWFRHAGGDLLRVRVAPPAMERQRHRRKYAQGELTPDESFYFRGPQGKLNLRAQNLAIFLQLAEGVDDGTWLHHLRSGDYSRWFRAAIKDEGLAMEAAQIESAPGRSAADSRARIAAAIRERYSPPA